MARRLSSLYARRIVNINVNIVVAGVFSLLPVTVVVHLVTRFWFNGEVHTAGGGVKWTITAITFIADIVFDVAIYYILHWWANHAPWHEPRPIEFLHRNLTFVQSATLVQFERAALSPLLYAFALGTQRLLMQWEYRPEWATILGFLVGIAFTRVLHTFWMVNQERRARLRHEQGGPRINAAERGSGTAPFDSAGHSF